MIATITPAIEAFLDRLAKVPGPWVLERGERIRHGTNNINDLRCCPLAAVWQAEHPGKKISNSDLVGFQEYFALSPDERQALFVAADLPAGYSASRTEIRNCLLEICKPTEIA